jgi:hypothetical protein
VAENAQRAVAKSLHEIFVHLLTLAVVQCCRTGHQPRYKLLQVVALHSIIFSVAARMASDGLLKKKKNLVFP